MNKEKIKQQIKELDTDNIINTIDVDYSKYDSNEIEISFNKNKDDDDLQLIYKIDVAKIYFFGDIIFYDEECNIDYMPLYILVYKNLSKIKKIIKDNL